MIDWSKKITVEQKAAEEHAAEVSAWKSLRQHRIDNLIVEFEGNRYQANEVSRQRMMQTVLVEDFDDVTVPWIDADNVVQQLSHDQMLGLLQVAIKETSKIWLEPRP